MNTKYCASCGHGTEYQLAAPKFCSSCGKPLNEYFKQSTAIQKPVDLSLPAGGIEVIKAYYSDLPITDLVELVYGSPKGPLTPEFKAVFAHVKTLKKVKTPTASHNDDDSDDDDDDYEASASSLDEMIHSLQGSVDVSAPPPFRIPASEISRHPELGTRSNSIPRPFPGEVS